MKIVKNNREVIVLVVIIAAFVAGVCGLSYTVRGGQPWAYSSVTLTHSAQLFIASLLK